MDRDQIDTIDSIGTKFVMTKVWKMSGNWSHTGNIVSYHHIRRDFSKIGKSKPYSRRWQHRQEGREVSPMSIVLYTNNPNITRCSVHMAKARNPP